VGGLIRPEGDADARCVDGHRRVASLVIQPLPGPNEPARPDAERETIVRDILRRVRYVLTLKARPPLRLAGIEMFERLSEILACLDTLIQHHAEERLVQLRHGLSQVLTALRPDYVVLRQTPIGCTRLLTCSTRTTSPPGRARRSGATCGLSGPHPHRER